MTAKIEYQLTPELAESLGFEAMVIRSPSQSKRSRWALPVLLGIILGFISAQEFASVIDGFFTLISAFSFTLITSDAPKQADYFSRATISAAIAALIGFGVGFGLGKFFQSSVRKKIRQHAVESITNFGANRSVFWNQESITLTSPVWQTSIHWTVLKRFVIGETGIHVLSDHQTVLFSIPKSVMPQNITTEEIVKTWQSYCSKPPKMV